MNCSLPSMETALVEKLQRTYMLAAMWNKEKWLNVESSIGEQSVSAGGQKTAETACHFLFHFLFQVNAAQVGQSETHWRPGWL